MEAVSNIEKRTVKNLEVGTPDRFARTLAVTQAALTKSQEERIVEDLTFLTELERKATQKQNQAKKKHRQFKAKKQNEWSMAALVPVIPVTGVIDKLPEINNLAVKASAITLAYAGVVYITSQWDVYKDKKQMKNYYNDCQYVKRQSRARREEIINSIR